MQSNGENGKRKTDGLSWSKRNIVNTTMWRQSKTNIYRSPIIKIEEKKNFYYTEHQYYRKSKPNI